MSVTALRRGLAAACCLLLCGPAPSRASTSARHDRVEARIIRAINAVRTAHAVPALHPSHGLARAADAHSASMLRHNTLFHGAVGPRVRKYVRVRRVGENLAWMRHCNAGKIIRMWLRSPGHRRVLLSSTFRRVGVGKRSSARVCFVTADFGTAR